MACPAAQAVRRVAPATGDVDHMDDRALAELFRKAFYDEQRHSNPPAWPSSPAGCAVILRGCAWMVTHQICVYPRMTAQIQVCAAQLPCSEGN